MKIFKRVLIAIAILLLVIAAIGFMFPSKVHVERATVINQPKEKVFAYVNNLHNFNSWSPWHDMDTAATYTFEGPETGVGAAMKWESNNKDVGKGMMKFVEVVDGQMIREELSFMDEGSAFATFTFAPEEAGTRVTWAFEFEVGMNPLLRIIGKFMDGMVGKDFEKGLARLKSNLEKMPAGPALSVEVIDFPGMHYLALRDTASLATIGQKLGEGYGRIGQAMGKQGLNMAGAPSAFYYSESSTGFDMDIAIPVDKPGKADGQVKPGEVKAGKVAMVRFYGPYEKTGDGHAAIHAYLGANNLQIAGAPWESYVTDPMMEKDTMKWETDIYYPLQ